MNDAASAFGGEPHLAGRVELFNGDSREVLKGLPDNIIDSCVCDPPYALVSIVKRFGGENAAPARDGDVYARASAGFMGKQWDTGETAFAVEFWAEVMRVLKPGGHVIAFSGTRTYHRLAVAIEDAGFEIRDMVSWLYGSGFPKSHDVSKGIDKRRNWSALSALQVAILAARKALGISQSEAARRAGIIADGERLGGGGYMWFETGRRVPTRDQWPALKAALGMGDYFDACFEEAEREVTGTHTEWTDRINYAVTSKDGLRRDKPATAAAAEWQGWGTALKPACEPIVLARKPLAGTVAANVLEHGTGALNIAGCRIDGDKPEVRNVPFEAWRQAEGRDDRQEPGQSYDATEGRWPANVIHDGSPEVVAAFPHSTSGAMSAATLRAAQDAPGSVVYGVYGGNIVGRDIAASSGSAARFFYSAKADAEDRLGTKHPTVKPVDLMQYLCRLVTPPGGVVLDPFAGSGTTGEAAWREGFRCILIEREADYAEDIRRRLALANKGQRSRKRAIAKAPPVPVSVLQAAMFGEVRPC